jgi:Holliday junction DNA helicase RuvB
MIRKETNKQINEDQSLDVILRPKSWQEYIGQEKIKKNLSILLGAAKERNEPIEHLLFYGPAGLGKTSLAHLVAKEINSSIKVSSGPAIEKVKDLASILTNLSNNEILFIDEAHRLNKTIEEVLYPAMESRSLNIIIGQGPSARTIQLELPAFTLIAATTKIALLSGPLRSRFSGGIFKLEFYKLEEIESIISRSARILGVQINKEAKQEIAKRSRRTPRIANRLLKRVRDYAQIKRKNLIDKKTTEETFKLLEIDELGFESTDREFLSVLIEKFKGGPVGIQTLASALAEDAATIEEVYEPYLIQSGFIEKTPRGRIATARAYKHLGIDHDGQKSLL